MDNNLTSTNKTPFGNTRANKSKTNHANRPDSHSRRHEEEELDSPFDEMFYQFAQEYLNLMQNILKDMERSDMKGDQPDTDSYTGVSVEREEAAAQSCTTERNPEELYDIRESFDQELKFQATALNAIIMNDFHENHNSFGFPMTGQTASCTNLDEWNLSDATALEELFSDEGECQLHSPKRSRNTSDSASISMSVNTSLLRFEIRKSNLSSRMSGSKIPKLKTPFTSCHKEQTIEGKNFSDTKDSLLHEVIRLTIEVPKSNRRRKVLKRKSNCHKCYQPHPLVQSQKCSRISLNVNPLDGEHTERCFNEMFLPNFLRMTSSLKSDMIARESAKVQHLVIPKFAIVFKKYAKRSSRCGVVISKNASCDWMRVTGLFRKSFSSNFADQYFRQFSGRKIVLEIHEYVYYLVRLAAEKEMSVIDMIQRMSNCPPPSLTKKSPLKKPLNKRKC